ncbi:protein-L-isoaspartate O-methyltransferase [Amanita rubescens]|nr:protein-L-isoaspartate O-methyltransferase [Amanita rubescens]
MAWRSSGLTNIELIANLNRHGILKSDATKNAMLLVDRTNYVRDHASAYEDSPQRIGHGATISAPHMHAYALENLFPLLKPGASVLDVGSGSGYLLAIFHRIVGETGKVVGIEHVPELVEWSKENLRKDGLGNALDAKQIEVIVGDGRDGYAEKGPYNAIHVGAAAPNVPSTLVNQLASPGRMFIPVGIYMQDVQQIDKDENDRVTQQPIMSVSYVPLTDREKQGDW